MIKKIILLSIIISFTACEAFKDHGAYSEATVVTFNAFLGLTEGCLYPPGEPPETEEGEELETAFLMYKLKVMTPDTIAVCYMFNGGVSPNAFDESPIIFKATNTIVDPGGLPSIDSFDIPSATNSSSSSFFLGGIGEDCPFDSENISSALVGILDMEKLKDYNYIVLVGPCGYAAGTVTNPFKIPM